MTFADAIHRALTLSRENPNDAHHFHSIEETTLIAGATSATNLPADLPSIFAALDQYPSPQSTEDVLDMLIVTEPNPIFDSETFLNFSNNLLKIAWLQLLKKSWMMLWWESLLQQDFMATWVKLLL